MRAALTLAVCLLVMTTWFPEPLGGGGRVTLFIAGHGPAARPALAEVPISAYESDVRRIAGVFEDLELPLPSRITLRLYSSPDLFAAWPGRPHGVSPNLPLAKGLAG